MTIFNNTKRDGIRSIVYNAGFLVFSRLFEKAIRFLYVIILARYLGPELLGIYNFGLASYLIFLPVAVWGMGILLSVHIGKKPENADSIIATTFVLRTVTTLFALMLCFGIGWFSHNDLLTSKIVFIFTFSIIGRSFAVWSRSCFVASEQSHYSAVLEIGFRLVEFICGIVYLLMDGGIIGLCIIHSGCWLIEGVTGLFLVRSRFNIQKFSLSKQRVYTFARDAFPIAINMFFFTALLQSGFVVLKSISTDKLALGYYTIGFQLVVNTGLIPTAFGKAAMPVLSRASERGTDETIVFLEMMLKICALFSAILAITLICFNSLIINLVFGPEYLKASGPLFLSALAMMSYYALTFTNNILNAGGRYIPAALSMGAALIVSLVSTVLVSSMQQNAPAIGLMAGASVALVLQLFIIQNKIGKVAWWQSFFKPYIIAIIAVAVTWGLKDFGIYGFIAGSSVMCSGFMFSKMFTANEMGYVIKLLPWLK